MNYAFVDKNQSTFKTTIDKPIKIILQDGDRKPVNLTGATAKVRIASPTKLLLEKVIPIADALKGMVQLSFTSTEDLDSGSYELEVEITYPNATKEIFPDTSFLKINVKKALQRRETEFEAVTDFTLLRDNITAMKATADKAVQDYTGKIDSKIDLLSKRKNDILRANKTAIKKWNFPDWFTWKDAPITILSDGTNFYTPFDVSTFKNVGGKTIYVDPVSGVDTNDGLSWAKAVTTMDKAYSLAANNDTILIKPGVYKRTRVISASTIIDKNINIIVDGGGTARWYQGDDHTYTKTAGATNVYQTVRNNITHVIDIQLQSVNGETIALTKTNSIAECDALEGSYFNDGTNTFIHMFGHIAPNNSNVVILLSTGNPCLKVTNTVQNVNLYVEGIEFFGGSANIYISNSATYLDPNIYMKNCKMRYAYNLNAVHILGAKNAFFQNCEASFSVLDGFNYHLANGKIVKSIEVNCIGRGNGDNTKSTNVNNGSTTHDGSKAIRINCTYYENMGVNCCDVTEDTMSINLGVAAFNSVSQDVNGMTHGNFSAQQPGTTMYLEGCVSFGSTYGIGPVTGTTMYLKNCLYDTKNGGGTLTIL